MTDPSQASHPNPSIQLILDEGLPYTAAQLLRNRGIEAHHVSEINLAGCTDEIILAESVRRQAVVVCYDSDFHRILALSGATAPSVIRIRIEGLKGPGIADLLHTVLQQTTVILQKGAVITVTDQNIRGRLLPLQG